MATRQAIRSEIAERISFHFKTTFDYRPGHITDDQLPCAAAYFESGETDGELNDDPETLARLVIEIKCASEGNIDADLDTLGTLAANEFTNDRSLNGLVDYIVRQGFEYERDPDSFYGTLSIHFDVLYTDED